MGIPEAIETFLLSCLASFLFIRLCPSRRQCCRDFCVIWLIAVTAVYTWHRYAVIPAFEFASLPSWWQWSFAVMEGMALVYEMWSYWVVRRLTDHSPEADRCEAALRRIPRESLPSVVAFFPTYSEPLELVETSLRAALTMEYDGRMTLCCLDDGKKRREPAETEKLRRFCQDHGIKYLARTSGERGKSGNLSHGYRETNEDIILVFDCDFQVEPGCFVWRVVGLLHAHPEIGIVQCPQSYSNDDPISTGLLASGGVCDAQASFMRVVQPGRDYWGNAFCVGSGWAVPRKILDTIGGFAALETVGEDFEVTYRLILKGYRTMYLNEVLAFGLAPEGLNEFYNQVSRWCLGSMQQLTLSTGPLRGKFNLLDRLFYLDAPIFWLTHFFTLQLLIAPLVFLFLGVDAIPDPGGYVLAALAPRLATRTILQYWLTERISLPFVSALPKALSAIPVTLTILSWIWISATAPFRVTDKWRVREVSIVRWPMFAVFAGITLMILTGVAMHESAMLDRDGQRAAALNYFWAVGSAVICFLAALVCIEMPTQRAEVVVGQSVQEGNLGIVLRGIVRRVFCGH